MQIKIPDGVFSGYIFDLDGTLVDTMPLHYAAWESALQKAGLQGRLDEELFYELGGVPSRKVASLLGKRHGLNLDPVAVYRDKEEAFMGSLQKLDLILPVVEFARKVSAAGYPVSIASGGTHDVVTSTLQKTGLAPLFPVVVTADDVEHGAEAERRAGMCGVVLRRDRRGRAQVADVVGADARGLPGREAELGRVLEGG